MKTQVIVIHGADSFETYEAYLNFLKNYHLELSDLTKKSWKSNLQNELGSEYEVLTPQMPNKQNARYSEWKIWFEKILSLLNKEIILVGHSMGGIFIAKYLSENKIDNKVLATFLVAAPFEDIDHEKICDFNLSTNLKQFEKQGGAIILYHSSDDPVVPVDHVGKYKKELPNAQVKILEKNGHFGQEMFPELADDIKSL